MQISLTTFVSDLQRYLTDHPGAAGDEAHRSLTALAERTFENAEEAGLTLTEFVQTVQESNNEELKAVVQQLFDQAIQKLPSTTSIEAPPAKRQHRESAIAETGFQNLGQDCLAHIFGFLHPKSQSPAGAVCRTWHEALRCRQRWDLADDPKVTQLLSSFGMSFPPQNASLEKKEAAWNDIFAKVAIILKGIHDSKALSVEEKKPFFEKTSQQIVNDPNLWRRLLHTAYELSLVSPFLNGNNQGPELSNSMTLAEKAKAVRNHLKEKGGTYIELQCSGSGMLCFPIEFCSLQNLQRLFVSDNQIAALPPQIGQLAALQRLSVSSNQIISLPPQIAQLAKLQWLSVPNNQITSLPPQIGLLAQLQELDVSFNQIAALPQEIGQLAQLQELDVSHNHLTSLPPQIGQLVTLKGLGVSDNQITSLPPQIGQLVALKGLSVSDNQITSLPPQIGQLVALQVLVVVNNQITALPPEITGFTQNISIVLSNNPLTTIPKLPENIRAYM